jgi:hypothetical protein
MMIWSATPDPAYEKKAAEAPAATQTTVAAAPTAPHQAVVQK